jgi:hypothetical protein
VAELESQSFAEIHIQVAVFLYSFLIFKDLILNSSATKKFFSGYVCSNSKLDTGDLICRLDSNKRYTPYTVSGVEIHNFMSEWHKRARYSCVYLWNGSKKLQYGLATFKYPASSLTRKMLNLRSY